MIFLLPLEVDFWAGCWSVDVAEQGGPGRRGRVFCQHKVVKTWPSFFFSPPRRFSLRLSLRLARFSLQFEIIGERDGEHVAERAQHATDAGIRAVEARHIRVLEEAY